MLFTSTAYPEDYGYIENTLGQDGDPLDALVLLQAPTFPGCLIECRAIGMFRMTDEAGGDDKVLCVPSHDPRLQHLQDIEDVSKFDRLEIQHFFEVYKDLEPGKSVEGANWVGRDEAEAEVRASFERAKTPATESVDRGSARRSAGSAAPLVPVQVRQLVRVAHDVGTGHQAVLEGERRDRLQLAVELEPQRRPAVDRDDLGVGRGLVDAGQEAQHLRPRPGSAAAPPA